ncbi:MAG: methyltransferase domain-containing protein [Alistipes sp.]|jgi:SAM-dependent methyltransferase|nr:methyltransferase domain-containing protein [Alistipes sp.]
MIRFLLNHIPRGTLQRVAGWAMPLAGIFYAGRGVECPLCGAKYRHFMPYGYVTTRRNALCPRCLSLERHRLLWLWLEREKKIETLAATGGQKFLHIAPEVCLSKKFSRFFSRPGRPRPSPGGRPADYRLQSESASEYITADLESPLADVHLDVQAIPFPDATFDIVFCNHVLEHVADDRLAMREMQRVTKPGGWGVMLSPVDPARAVTFEDDTVTDPEQRTRLFGQYDHRRVYGRDYATRLREEGWNVEEIDYLAALTPDERRLYALRPEILFVVKKT